MDGRATLVVGLGGQKAVLTGGFAPSLQRDGSVHVEASLSQVTPKALADSAPILAPLAALDVPLTLDGEADLGRRPDAHAHPPDRASRRRQGADGHRIDPDPRCRDSPSRARCEQASIERAVVELQAAPGGPVSTFGATGQLTHQANRLTAALHLTLDHAAFADLPALWPADIAADARTWITENIQVGTAHDGTADLVLETPDTTPDITLLKATATLEGDDIAVTWLPTVPRVEQAKAHLVLTDPDKVEIDVRVRPADGQRRRSDRGSVRSRHHHRPVEEGSGRHASSARRTEQSPAPSRC